MSQGSLLATLSRIRAAKPECSPLVTHLEQKAAAGWNPYPQEVINYLLTMPTTEENKQQKHDVLMMFINLCLHTDNTSFNTQLANLTKK